MSSIVSELPTLTKRPFTILFDTGSSINFIHPDLAKNKNCKLYDEIITFKTVNGKSKCTKFTTISLNKKPIKCYDYNFHKNYNLLFGIEAFKTLNIHLDFTKNTVNMENKTYDLTKINKNSNNEINNIEIRNKHMSTLEKQKLNNLIKNYADLFPNKNQQLSCTNIIEHKIILDEDTPIHTKNYRLPQI